MNTIPLMHQWLVHFINSPDEEAYVQVGDKVTNESTVCILEAMKLFNEIQAETTGNHRNFSRRRTNGRVWPAVI